MKDYFEAANLTIKGHKDCQLHGEILRSEPKVLRALPDRKKHTGCRIYLFPSSQSKNKMRVPHLKRHNNVAELGKRVGNPAKHDPVHLLLLVAPQGLQ